MPIDEPTNHPEHPHSEHAPDIAAGHEESTVSLRNVVKFLVVFTVVNALILVMLVGLIKFFGHQNAQTDVQPSPLASTRQPPPEPRLQPEEKYHESIPHEDLRALRTDELARLQSYGWTDRAQQIAFIPINRAIDLAIENGLPLTLPALGTKEADRAEFSPTVTSQPQMQSNQ